jgi:hypothetical protein
MGRIFDPERVSHEGMSAALMPIAEVLDHTGGLIRVYYSPRDTHNRSQVRYFDIELNNPTKIIGNPDEPLLSHGKLGAFDDSGMTLGSVVNFSGKRLLYYTGWNLTESVPYNNSIGVAEFTNDLKLKRLGDGPVMTRTLNEPYSCASPFVMNDSGLLKMWYASMDKWVEEKGTLKHYYNIKSAHSADGVNWVRPAQVAINYSNPSEYAFGRPFVMKEDGVYKMWYSFRGDAYIIGYAESKNGVNWTRLDNLAGISTSNSGWDSEMLEYPFIFDCQSDRYMLYNGNDFGKSGIGLARFE